LIDDELKGAEFREVSQREGKKTINKLSTILACGFELLIFSCHAWHAQRRSNKMPSVILRDDLISLLQQGRHLEPSQKACATV